MTVLEKLEWALHTLEEKLKFGLPEEIAIVARDRRVKGVLVDVIKELTVASEHQTNKELEEPCKEFQHSDVT